MNATEQPLCKQFLKLAKGSCTLTLGRKSQEISRGRVCRY